VQYKRAEGIGDVFPASARGLVLRDLQRARGKILGEIMNKIRTVCKVEKIGTLYVTNDKPVAIVDGSMDKTAGRLRDKRRDVDRDDER
jgi:hypothetical protein